MINYEIFNKDYLEYKFLRRIAEYLNDKHSYHSSVWEMAKENHSLLNEVSDIIYFGDYLEYLEDKTLHMFQYYINKELTIKDVTLNINEESFFELKYDFEPGYNTKMFSLSYCYHNFNLDEDDNKIIKNKEVFKEESKLFEALNKRLHSDDISKTTSLEDTPNYEFK